MSRAFIVSSIVTASIASATFAATKEPHPDIWVTASGSSLITGGWNDTTGEVIAPSLRVFEGELGLDPSFPFSGDEPGIGSDLVGTTLTMNILQGISVWNGSGYSASANSILASYGGQDASSMTGGSFSFLVSAGLDLHPEYTLMGSGGVDPANGIYLVSFTMSAPSYATSETFWAVLNLNESEEAHGAATAWVEANLVPAPAALAPMLLAFITSGRSRTRRRSTLAAC
jgi:hypothetical protein